MATTLSSIFRFQTSSQDARIQPGAFGTSVTERRPPGRELTPPALLNLPREPEDARITGGTRSLARRLLALNLSGVASPKVLAQAHTRPNAA